MVGFHHSRRVHHNRLGAVVATALLLAGCATAPVTTAPPPGAVTEVPVAAEPVPAEPGTAVPGDHGPVRVALLLPLSGPDGEIGQALLNTAELALFDVGAPRLTLLPRDTGGTPEGAAAAARSALEAGARVILGPLFSTSVSAAAPIARDRGIAMIAFSTDRAVAGDGVYLLGFVPAQQVTRVVAHARGQGITNFAALAPDSAYGHAVMRAFSAALKRFDGDLKAVEFYPQNAGALTGPVKELGHYQRRRADLLAERKSLTALGEDDSLATERLAELAPLETLGTLDFDALFLPEGGALLRALAPLLPFYEIDPLKIRFLGTGLWDDPGLSREPPLIGGWFAGPAPNTGAALTKRYRAVFDRAPPRIASLAYDAVALVAHLARTRPRDPFSPAALTDANGFAGIDGIFRFHADGIAERGLAVIEVRPKGFVVLSPAPTSFQPAVN